MALKVLNVHAFRPCTYKALRSAHILPNNLANNTDEHDDQNDDTLVWLVLHDGQLVATVPSGSRRLQLDLSSCINVFGLVPRCQRLPDNYRAWLQRRTELLTEAATQLKFDQNRNVVQIVEVCEDLGTTYRNQHQIVIVQEYCAGKDLIEHLESRCHLSLGPGLHVEEIRR